MSAAHNTGAFLELGEFARSAHQPVREYWQSACVYDSASFTEIDRSAHFNLSSMSLTTTLQNFIASCSKRTAEHIPPVILSTAALTKLEAFRIRGAGLIAEEQPGLLSELCQHLTYLLLHGEKVSLREPISSPSLQFLSIICPLTHRLPGACPPMGFLLCLPRIL